MAHKLMPKVLLVSGLSVSILAAVALRPAPPQPGGLQKGQPAPAFRLYEASGKAVALQDFRGKVVYLDFWGSWCKPCLAEAPAAATLKKKFLGREVVFVYIAQETYVDGWLQAIAHYALASSNSVHLLDPDGKYAAHAYRVESFPTYMIIDRNGRVLDSMAPRPSDGAATVTALEQALASK